MIGIKKPAESKNPHTEISIRDKLDNLELSDSERSAFIKILWESDDTRHLVNDMIRAWKREITKIERTILRNMEKTSEQKILVDIEKNHIEQQKKEWHKAQKPLKEINPYTRLNLSQEEKIAIAIEESNHVEEIIDSHTAKLRDYEKDLRKISGKLESAQAIHDTLNPSYKKTLEIIENLKKATPTDSSQPKLRR